MFHRRGKLQKAQQLHTLCRQMQHEELWALHPDTLDSLYFQANMLMEQGLKVESQKVLELCARGRERVLGVSHLDTVRAVQMLVRMHATDSVPERLPEENQYLRVQNITESALKMKPRVAGKELPLTLVDSNWSPETFWGDFYCSSKLVSLTLVQVKCSHICFVSFNDEIQGD